MKEISKYFGKNKSAVVYRIDESSNHYVVELSMNGRVYQKTNAYSQNAAEDLAEDFVLNDGENKTFLLNENNVTL